MKREVNIIKTSYVNVTHGYSIGEETINISDSFIKTLSDLYKFGLKEYGKCKSKVYIDTKAGQAHIGYYFERKEKYENTEEYYIRGVWVSIEKYTEEIIREYLPID